MASPKTQAQAPLRSLDQRMEALKRANDIRVRRAQLKKDLKDGDAQIEEILSDPPEYVSTAKVFDMLMAVPKFGRVKAARFLNTVPDQPVEDGRRPLGPAAGGADWPLQPLRSAHALSSSSPARRAPARGRSRGCCWSACPDELELAVSATTRPVRPGEQDGRDYWFLSDEEFDRRLDEGDFLE